MIRVNKTVTLTAFILFSGIFGNIFGYETEWNDPKFIEKKTPEEGAAAEKPNSKFKIDGKVWAGYDFLDRDAIGVPDAAGKDKAGFRIGRAYMNMQGEVTEGFAKGWDYRTTVDAGRASSIGDGCATSNCKKNDDYVVFLKFAYITMPIPLPFGKTGFRIGQQPTPTTEAQTGYNQTDIWAYRFLDTAGKAPWEDAGLSSSADVGVSFIHKNTYYGLQLMLGNGEGYHKANAEGLDISGKNVKLEDIATGKSAASYGYDLYGMLSFTPTGKNKDIIATIGFPFRVSAIGGADHTEYNRSTADFTDLNAPKYTFYKGEKKALQDVTYGAEANLELNKNDYKLTVGAGTALLIDKAGYGYKFDETMINGVYPGDYQKISSHYVLEENRVGYMNYGFMHGRIKKFGAFVRVIAGSSGSSLDGKVGSIASKKKWESRLINSDTKDGIIGNLSLQELHRLDNTNATFRTDTFGVTYFAHERFKISLGTRSTTGTDSYGKEFRQNRMEAIESSNPKYANAAQQVVDMKNPQYQQKWTSIGYTKNDQPDLNDFIGIKRVDREVFIRSEYSW